MQNAGQALRVGAMTLRRDSSALGDAHRRRCFRMDSRKAIKATAHQLARLIYAMVTMGVEYQPESSEALGKRLRDQQIKRLAKQAERLGFTIAPETETSVMILNQVVASEVALANTSCSFRAAT